MAARGYAERLVTQSNQQLEKLITSLGNYDQAVASHAAYLLQNSGKSLLSADVQSALRDARPATRAGFRAYLEAWRENQMAKVRR